MKITFKSKVTLLILLLISLFAISIKFGSSFSSNKVEILASRVMDKCSNKSDKSACYDVEIPKLLSRNILSFEESFALTKIVQFKDRSYLFCHVLGHNLADVETKKDPSKWLDVVANCPPLECNNGCPHGAIMRRFKGQEVLEKEQIETIISDLGIACEERGEWKPTEVESFMCYHSMGHVLMYITGADIRSSLSYCKEIGIKSDGRDFYQTCVQGVFMIIFQGIDPEDIALVKDITPKKENLIEFCSSFAGLENTACRTESWPLFYDQFKNPEGVNTFCSFAKNSYDKTWCFDTILRGPLTLDLLNTSGVKAVANYCLGLPKNTQEYCFATIATSWVQNEPEFIKESVDLCEEARSYDLEDDCYNGLLYYSKYSFHLESDQWRSYCESFKEPYRNTCLSAKVPETLKGLQ